MEMRSDYGFKKLESPRDAESLRIVLRELCATYGDVARVRIGFVTKRSFLRAICFVDMKEKTPPVPEPLRKLGFRRHKSSFYISFRVPGDFRQNMAAAMLLTQQIMDFLCTPILLGC